MYKTKSSASNINMKSQINQSPTSQHLTSYQGWSTEVGCSSVLAATDHEREPRCAICGSRGNVPDLGIGGSAFPLARTQRRCIAVCEDLPHLSGGEVQQSGKSRFIATLGDSLKEMDAYNYGPGHRPARVQWLYGYWGLRGQTDKDGTSRPLYKGGDSHGICETLCGSRLLTTRSPRSDHIWSGSLFYWQVLEVTFWLAWYGFPVQHGVSSPNWCTKRADDPDDGKFPEIVCREATYWLESLFGVGGVCGKQCRQCGYRLHPIFSQFWQYPIIPSCYCTARMCQAM